MKREMITEIAATIAFSAIQNNDKIGVIFFSDKIEKFIPPQKGRKHTLFILRELIDFEPSEKKTDIGMILKYLTGAIKKRCSTFLISDFINSAPYNDALSIASKKHDVVAIQVYDRREEELPRIGLMKVKDAETDREMWIDSSSTRIHNAYKDWWRKRQDEMVSIFQRNRVDSVSIRTDEDFVKSLISLFARRS